MQGKTRKGNTYYACGYRIAYGDNAAEAIGHGKWQYVREDAPGRADRRLLRHAGLRPESPRPLPRPERRARQRADRATTASERERLARQVGEVEQRIERQLAAIEAGVDPVLVGERIRALKAKREEAEAALAELELDDRQHGTVEPEEACAILDALPDLGKLTGGGRSRTAPRRLRRLPAAGRDRPKQPAKYD